MTRTLFVFLLLLGSVYLGIQLQQDPGYLLIAIHHWTVETTLWLAIISMILVFIALHLFLLWLRWLSRLPVTWSKYLAKRRIQKAQVQTQQGFIEFSEGHWSQAKNHLMKALPGSKTPLLNYLTAAHAAQEMGDTQSRDNYLRQAQQSMPEAEIAVELTRTQFQLANHQWEQALATLKHLQELAPQHPQVLKLLMHLYVEVKDWYPLIALLPQLQRKHILSDSEFQQLQQKAYLQAMLDLIKLDHSQALEKFVSALPKQVALHPNLITPYCNYLINQGESTKAESILRHALKKHFDDAVITLYGQITANDTQLKFAESLLKSQPHSAALLLCLGRLSKTQHLWGKAKIYFEQSIEVNPTTTAYTELGNLLLQLNDQTGACSAFQQGLVLLTGE